MGQATVTPESPKVPPTQSASLEVSGNPTGDTIVLECSGSFGAVRSSLTCHCIPRREIVGALPADARFRSVLYREAEQLPHRSGKEEKDAQASNQAVWSAVGGETAPGHIVYGPYAPLPEGRYLALFRLKRTGEGEGVVAALDACVAGGHDSVKRDVRADELPVGEYRCIPIEFKHPGGPLETRVLWGGKASLSVDSIMVWEIGGLKGAGPPG
jgi:hypothetical protein